MKKKYILISIVILVAVAFGSQSCDGMDDNFRQYLQERNYSGRVDSLVATPGVERVHLRWVNPTDQRSRSILIVYGADNRERRFDTLVSEASIDGLTDAVGREFTVFTLDAFGNRSVPTSTTAIPVTRQFIDNLAAPTPVVMAVGLDKSISFIGASNVLMRFAGQIRYRITAPDGRVFEGLADLSEQKGDAQANMSVTEHLGVDILAPGAYLFEYEFAVYPVMGGVVTEDVVWLKSSRYVPVGGVRFDLIADGGTFSANAPRNSPGGENIDRIFDGIDNTKLLVFLRPADPTTSMPGWGQGLVWMQWRMNRPFGITEYTLTMANDAQSRDPQDWVILASNDGENWVEIDRQTNWNPDGRTVRFSRWTFQVPPTEPFYYWRMFVTRNHGADIFQMSQWRLVFDTDAL